MQRRRNAGKRLVLGAWVSLVLLGTTGCADMLNMFLGGGGGGSGSVAASPQSGLAQTAASVAPQVTQGLSAVQQRPGRQQVAAIGQRPAGTYQQPAFRQTGYSQPSYSQPSYNQAGYSQPTYRQPSYSQPTNTGGFRNMSTFKPAPVINRAPTYSPAARPQPQPMFQQPVRPSNPAPVRSSAPAAALVNNDARMPAKIEPAVFKQPMGGGGGGGPLQGAPEMLV